jgi:hypothetical protein
MFHNMSYILHLAAIRRPEVQLPSKSCPSAAACVLKTIQNIFGS